MKKIKLVLATAIAITGLFSCKKDALDVNITMPSVEVGFTIDTTLAAGEITASTTKSVNLDSLAATKNTNTSLFKSLKATKVKFLITPDTSTANFNDVQSGSIVISNPGANNTVTLASFSTANINPNSKQFEIIPADINILDYSRQKLMTVDCKIKTKGAVKRKYSFKIIIDTYAVVGAK
ncbi:MAG: hypothetical protein RL060_1438 [Bacteroidota bacterium]